MSVKTRRKPSPEGPKYHRLTLEDRITSARAGHSGRRPRGRAEPSPKGRREADGRVPEATPRRSSSASSQFRPLEKGLQRQIELL